MTTMTTHSRSSVLVAAKEAKDSANRARRQQLLHLVDAFLRDEGFPKTRECFAAEAKLRDDCELCDNVDLDIVLREYVNFFQLKFDKPPQICKFNVKIRPTKAIDKSVKETENARQIAHNDQSKPIGEFLSSVSNECRAAVESVYNEAIERDVDISWDDVKGLESAKIVLNEAVMCFEGLRDPTLAPWKTVLLHGPPGNGKTLLARALAGQSKRLLFSISPSVVTSKWRGESEKLVKVFFELARHYSPSILFFDEVESQVSSREFLMEHEASRRSKSEMLIELDGLNQHYQDVLFLATTNMPWDLDRAFLRRMEKRIYIPPPDTETRSAIFKRKLLNVDNIDFTELANKTEGYCSSDIQIICKEAAMSAARRIPKNRKAELELTQEDLLSAIWKIRPVTTKDQIEKYTSWNKKYRAD